MIIIIQQVMTTWFLVEARVGEYRNGFGMESTGRIREEKLLIESNKLHYTIPDFNIWISGGRHLYERIEVNKVLMMISDSEENPYLKDLIDHLTSKYRVIRSSDEEIYQFEISEN